MNISYIPNYSMEMFHKNEDIQNLVSLCMEYYDSCIFEDIIGSINSSNKQVAELFLDEVENKYQSSTKIFVFDNFKRSIINLFENSQIKNLKGAFLEVLSFRMFENYFKPYVSFTDYNVCINSWESHLTVDIAMEYKNSGLVCECKVPSSKFNSDIFNNLLDIKQFSGNYFHPYVITLDNKSRMNSKKQRIEHAIGEYGAFDEIYFITRELLGNFYDIVNE